MRLTVRAFLRHIITATSLLMLLPAHVIEPASLSKPNFFANAFIEDYTSYKTLSDGDLWPSCWADDDNLYTANGDGRGFNLLSLFHSDIAVNRISGTLPDLKGQTIASGNAVGQVWNLNGRYNRKPSSMLCVDNTIYLAIQDLNKDFNDAPATSISKSVDHGITWTWDSTKPMFDRYQFTTLMFLDYGKNNAYAIDQYIYVYGLDYNWRESVDHSVPDPMDMYLARVPKTSIQTRATWQFYSGLDDSENPVWASELSRRVPVLHFDRANYLSKSPLHFANLPALAQGGVVYNKPLNRYIYSTWTQYTFEFYEAPQPWGPWTHFLTSSFGQYSWSSAKHGAMEQRSLPSLSARMAR